MLLVALAALAVVVAAAVAVGLVRRRRTARGPALSLATSRRRAGVSHLATGVSELSDLGLHLHASAAPRRRLGELLGSSSGASR